LIALQARANGELSHRLGNGLQAALVSFTSGLIIIVVIALFNPSIKEGVRTLRRAVIAKAIPPWTLFAGMLGASFVAVQTQIVPLIGVAIYSVAAIAGQSAISLVVDRIGLTGGGKKEITPRRVTAAFVTVFAVFISVADRLDGKDLSIAAVVLGVLAGAIVGVQRALNGQINEHSQQSFTTSLLNFAMGTTFLLVLLLFAMTLGGMKLSPLPAGPWWIYTGGAIGVLYVAFTSTIVQHLGVLTFTLISVGGQLAGSLLIDLYSPTDGVRVSIYLVSGIVLTYLGVLVGGVRNSQLKRAATEK
jgi:transporter family-2 protein